jgi:Predicted membrane protein (DUF2254)
MADIAVKALSAAINDPTTAVQALDYLGNVLRLLGSTPLHGPLVFRDQQGTPRLFMPGRTWEDYLTLAVTEIREYGSTSIQVMRRMRALLEDLQESGHPDNRPAVDAEITSSTPRSPRASQAQWTRTGRSPPTCKASAARRQATPAHEPPAPDRDPRRISIEEPMAGPPAGSDSRRRGTCAAVLAWRLPKSWGCGKRLPVRTIAAWPVAWHCHRRQRCR